MAEPTYSEIVNTPVNPTTGSGTAAVVIDNSDEIARLNQQAQYKAESDWRKYNMFLHNFKDLAKDANTIAALPVATTDRPILQKQMIDIMGEISKNPASALGGKGMFDIQQKLQKLTSDAHESKANNAFDLAHRQFILAHPDFNTDDNKSTIESYLKDKPLGSREPYMLDATPKFDLGKFVQTGYELPGVKSPYANAGVTPDGQNIFEDTGEVWNPEPFNKYFTGGLQRPDIRKAAQNLYNQLPPEKKKAYEQGEGVPLEKFWDDIKKTYTPPEGTYIKKRDLKGNPNYLEKEKLAQKAANDRAEMGLKWANYNLEKSKVSGAGKEDFVNAKSVLDEAVSIIQKGEEFPVEIGGGKTETRLRISDPTLLNTFGNIDKEGKVTNIPDVIEYDKNKDQAKLVYYDKEKTASGKNVIVKEVPLDQRTWLKHIAKRSFPNKDIGKVNSLVEDVLNQNENSLYKISQKKDLSNQQPEAKSAISGYPANIQAGIKAFAAANKMSEEEAIKVLKANKKI